MNRPSRPLRGCVRLYQDGRAGRPSPCRYDPSCSSYAMEALEVHGALRGSYLSVRRVLRCHPWGGFGFDPVPDVMGNMSEADTTLGALEPSKALRSPKAERRHS